MTLEIRGEDLAAAGDALTQAAVSPATACFAFSGMSSSVIGAMNDAESILSAADRALQQAAATYRGDLEAIDATFDATDAALAQEPR